MNYPWKRNLYILWTSVFFVSMAYSMIVPFMPIFLHDELGVEDHLETWAGTIFAISFFASAVTAPFWGALADKYGRKQTLLRSGFCLMILHFASSFVVNPYQLLVIRLLQGLFGGFVPSAVAMIATNTPEKNVGYALGVMSTAGAAGTILGPLIGGIVSHWIGNRESFLFSGSAILAAFLIAWIWTREEKIERSSTRISVIRDLKSAMANTRLVTVLGMVMMTSMSVMLLEPLLTIYVIQLGASNQSASLSAGIIFSSVGVAALIAAPRWGKLGTKVGYEKILMIGLIGGGLGNIAQIMLHNLVGFGILRFTYGLFFAAVYPSLNALIVKVTDPSFRGRAFSLNQSSMQAGMMIGPLLGGFLANLFSITTVFIINGFVMIVIAGILKGKALDTNRLEKSAMETLKG